MAILHYSLEEQLRYEGREEDREEGREEEREEGIKNMIEPFGELGADRAFIVSKVVQRYNLTREEAESRVDMYLPKHGSR